MVHIEFLENSNFHDDDDDIRGLSAWVSSSIFRVFQLHCTTISSILWKRENQTQILTHTSESSSETIWKFSKRMSACEQSEEFMR